jgi:hypothetical protein
MSANFLDLAHLERATRGDRDLCAAGRETDRRGADDVARVDG